jgi:DNA-binding NarL/FixJ family response regulator
MVRLQVNKPETIKVAIVEDSDEEREALQFLINGSPGFSCVAACGSAEEALNIIPRSSPDVVLMDIQLPGMSGIECIGRLKTESPDLEIMMLTVLEDHERIFQSLAAGASGYIVKKTPSAKLLEAIDELHKGGAPMSGQIARQVVETFKKPVDSFPATEEPPPTNLSKREREILGQLARGFLYKEICDHLGISIGTVRVHIRHIYDKLHVHNRTEAILKGHRGTQTIRPAYFP